MSYNTSEGKLKPTSTKPSKNNNQSHMYSADNDPSSSNSLPYSANLPTHFADLTMTIKQQQAIQDILKEILINKQNSNTNAGMNRQQNGGVYGGNGYTNYVYNYSFDNNIYEFDEDLQKMLKQSQKYIQKQYENMAKQQMWRNRMCISINDQEDKLKEIFERMDANSEISKQTNNENNRFKKSNKINELQIKDRKKRKESSTSQYQDAKSQISNQSEGFNINTLKLNYEDDIFLNVNSNKTKDYRARSNTDIDIGSNQLNLDAKIQGDRQSSSSNYESSDEEEIIQSSHSLLGNAVKIAHPQLAHQYILDKFQQEHILKPKEQSLQILQLDQKYPKINPMAMYRHQYPIFKFNDSSVTKYLRYMKKSMSEISGAVSFLTHNNVKWTILAIEYLLYIFIGEDWKEPIIVNPQRKISQSDQNSGSQNKLIRTMALSPYKNYLVISLGNEIIIYQIKKQTNLLIMVKNLNSSDDLNTKIININRIIFYEENPIKLAYIDNQQSIGLIVLEQIMLFTRVGERQVKHGLDIIMDMDVLNLDNSINNEINIIKKEENPKKGFGFGKFGINQKISNFITKTNRAYMALASRSTLMLFKIESNVEIICTQPLYQQTTKGISIRWRYHPQIQVKPQLFISYNNKIYIYKLMFADGNEVNNKNRQVYLQLHLMYQNHYDIMQMEIISNTHLLLHSDENIIVIAIPLIPSTDLSLMEIQNEDNLEVRKRKASGANHEMFESALVFIAAEKNCRILYTSFDEVLFYSNKAGALRVATLKPLQEYLDQLMLQLGHYREAFTLLILVYKGVNYSFKFSYTSQALVQCIFSAIQCTIGSLITLMDDNIIEYRIGWVVQLLLQTQNQNMIWTTVYKKLQQKQKERNKQQELSEQKIEEQRENSGRQSYYQHLYHDSSYKSQKNMRNAHKKSSLQYMPQRISYKFNFQHSKSLISQQTTSSQLLPRHRKSLQHLLFDILEIFVLKSQVTSMPQNIFLDFIAYQCQKQSDTVIEKIILQNKESYDGSKLLFLLQSKERNYLQLFLFSRALICEQQDFYTPFIKIFSSFRQYQERLQRGIRDNDEMEQVKEKIHNHAMICLWYLRKCLRFQRIPTGIMPLNQKITIISSLCTQILQPEITRRLFNFNPKVFLETYLLMFIGAEISLLIDEQNQNLVQKYKEFYPTIYHQIMSAPPSPMTKKMGQKDENEEIFDKTFKQLAVLHLQKAIPTVKSQNLYWAEFLALAFYFNPSEVCLTFEAVVDILIVFFQNKFQAYNLEVPPKSLQRPTIQALQMTLIEYIKPILLQKKDRFYINKLINFNDKNVAYYLYRIDQNYRLALEHFMASTHSNKFITFIHELLNDIKEIGTANPDNALDKSLRERKFAEIKQFLVKNIGVLFKKDKYQALNIFYEIGETSQTIYNLIEQNMAEKLDFLTAVLKKFEHEDFAMKQKFQLEHLSQVCRLKDKQMLQYLDKFYYPLDQAILVCEQKGNLLAKAILQERCGRIGDAFMSYQRIVKNIIQSNNSQSNQKTKSEKQIRRDVHKYTEECIRLCKKSPYDPNSNPQDNFWLRIITFINGFIKSNSQHKIFLKVQFEKVLQHILNEMFKFLPTNVLIDFFIAKGHRLELTITKQFSIFQNLFILAKFDIGVEKKVLEICKLDIKDTRKEALQTRKNGITCYGFCDFCKKPLLQENTCNVYSCKHSFHKICHEDIYRCLTCYYQSDDSILRSNIFGTELMKGFYNNNQLIPDVSKEKGKKELEEIKHIKIVVESAYAAKQKNYKKSFKLYDFEGQKQNTKFYHNIECYNEKEKERRQLQKMEEFENEYIRYTKQKGLEIKKRDNPFYENGEIILNKYTNQSIEEKI